MSNYTNTTISYSSSGVGAIYYRLIALWVLCEAMLGGIIHGLKIPVSGLIIGSCAVLCISLIAWYVPNKGAIIKATLVVAIFKMMLSPQAPPPAYIAVFFQGTLGELLFFRNRKFYSLSCIILALLALLESGLQRILVLTIVYGNDLWTVINNFINGLTKQKQRPTTASSLPADMCYCISLPACWWAGGPCCYHTGLLGGNRKNCCWRLTIVPPLIYLLQQKSKRFKKGLFIAWLLLIALYVQSYFKLGTPLLPSYIALKIFLRSLIIVLSWIFIVGPLLKNCCIAGCKKANKVTRGSAGSIEALTRNTAAHCTKLETIIRV